MECASARNTEEEEVSNKLLKDIGYGQAVDFDSTTNKRKVEDLKLPPGWTEFRFRICLKACTVPDRGAHVTLLHLVILHQDVELLQRLIKEITEEDLKKGYLKEKIKVKEIPTDFVVEDDRWLFDANCLHLATKFSPEGLNLLLSEDKVKEKAKELINTKTRVESTIKRVLQSNGCFPSCCSKETPKEAQTEKISQNMVEIAPLHIAAKKPNSISTR